MRNRAKCKLCESIIESKFSEDYVECKCGEIGVVGGSENYQAFFKHENNFLRVDDEGNEIVIQYKEKMITESKIDPAMETKPDKKELIRMLEEMIKNLEGLPPHVMSGPINHYDFLSSLYLLIEVLRCD